MTQSMDEDLEGSTVQSTDGSKIGKVSAVYYDQQTGKPEWVSVATGMFGSKEALVPLAGSGLDGDKITVTFDKDMVKDAPHIEPDGELSEREEAELFAYYGVPYGGETVTATGAPEGAYDQARDVDGPNTDTAMTRSEERLRVGTETVETGRARLRKRVVTENVTQTVPVSHEEVTIEREPITEGNREAAMSGPAFQEEDVEVTLNAERPVVAKETVPVERVSLGKETVADEETVSESVRKEEIDTTGVEDTSRH